VVQDVKNVWKFIVQKNSERGYQRAAFFSKLKNKIDPIEKKIWEPLSSTNAIKDGGFLGRAVGETHSIETQLQTATLLR
jgi:hypothetical protein